MTYIWVCELSFYWSNRRLVPCSSPSRLQHFADDLLKCIFLKENVWIPIKMSLRFVPKGPINKFLSLVQTLTWRRLSHKPLSKWRIYASFGLNEVIKHMLSYCQSEPKGHISMQFESKCHHFIQYNDFQLLSDVSHSVLVSMCWK